MLIFLIWSRTTEMGFYLFDYEEYRAQLSLVSPK